MTGFDATTQLLIETAANDAYTDLVTLPKVSAVTKFIREGDKVFRLRLSLEKTEDFVEVESDRSSK